MCSIITSTVTSLLSADYTRNLSFLFQKSLLYMIFQEFLFTISFCSSDKPILKKQLLVQLTSALSPSRSINKVLRSSSFYRSEAENPKLEIEHAEETHQLRLKSSTTLPAGAFGNSDTASGVGRHSAGAGAAVVRGAGRARRARRLVRLQRPVGYGRRGGQPASGELVRIQNLTPCIRIVQALHRIHILPQS